MKTKTPIRSLLVTAGAFVACAATANAALVYQYNYDGGGTGSTVVDVSGFGTQDDAVSYDSTTATANRVASTALTVSPDGGNYGNFATDDRRGISSFGSKWNSGTGSITTTDAVTITMLMRDVNLSGATNLDGSFFKTDNGGSPFFFRPTTTGTTTTGITVGIDGNTAATSSTADLSNGTGNGWLMMAVSYSSASDVAKVYLGRDFNSTTGLWGSFSQVGGDLSLVSTDIPAGDLGAATRFGFGGSSGDTQQLNGDDFRIYNEVLSESAIGDLYLVPEPSTFALLAGLATFGLVMMRRRLR